MNRNPRAIIMMLVFSGAMLSGDFSPRAYACGAPPECTYCLVSFSQPTRRALWSPGGTVYPQAATRSDGRPGTPCSGQLTWTSSGGTGAINSYTGVYTFGGNEPHKETVTITATCMGAGGGGVTHDSDSYTLYVGEETWLAAPVYWVRPKYGEYETSVVYAPYGSALPAPFGFTFQIVCTHPVTQATVTGDLDTKTTAYTDQQSASYYAGAAAISTYSPANGTPAVPGANTVTAYAVDNDSTPERRDGSKNAAATANYLTMTVQAFQPNTNDPATMPIAPGSVIELRATPNVGAPNPQYSWSGAGTVAEFVDVFGQVITQPTGPSVLLRGKNAGAAGITCTYAFSKFPGLYDPRASVSASVNVTVVEVDYIEINAEGAWRGAGESRTDVMAGSRFQCRAIPKPAGSAWPAGWPVWAGPSGSVQGEDIVNVYFDNPSKCTHLMAYCGILSKTAKFRIASALAIEYKKQDEGNDDWFKGDGGGVDGATRADRSFSYRLVFAPLTTPAPGDPWHPGCSLSEDTSTSYSTTALFTPLAIGWEMWELDVWNSRLLTGHAKRFDYTNADRGSTMARFYVDENWDNIRNQPIIGRNEPAIDISFHNHDLTTHTFSARSVDTISSATARQDISGKLAQGSLYVNTRDHRADYRALAHLQLGAFGTFPNTPTTKEIPETEADLVNLYANVDAKIIYVKQILVPHVNAQSNWTKIIVQTSNAADTYPHELGHTFGLTDWGPNPCPDCGTTHPMITNPTDFQKGLLMYHAGDRISPRRYLYHNEAKEYE